MGQGQLIARLQNRDLQSATVILTQVIPWYIRVYLHSLHIVCEVNGSSTTLLPLAHDTTPAKDHGRPLQSELVLRLPKQSQVTISFDYDVAWQRYAEFPPDALKGFDAGTAVLSVLAVHGQLPLPGIGRLHQNSSVRLYPRAVSIELPSPDFSMPYNVIMITSTLLAMIFNTLLWLTTGKFQPESRAKSSHRWLQRLQERLGIRAAPTTGTDSQETVSETVQNTEKD